jgi:hypothetical protein
MDMRSRSTTGPASKIAKARSCVALAPRLDSREASRQSSGNGTGNLSECFCREACFGRLVTATLSTSRLEIRTSGATLYHSQRSLHEGHDNQTRHVRFWHEEPYADAAGPCVLRTRNERHTRGPSSCAPYRPELLRAGRTALVRDACAYGLFAWVHETHAERSNRLCAGNACGGQEATCATQERGPPTAREALGQSLGRLRHQATRGSVTRSTIG